MNRINILLFVSILLNLCLVTLIGVSLFDERQLFKDDYSANTLQDATTGEDITMRISTNWCASNLNIRIWITATKKNLQSSEANLVILFLDSHGIPLLEVDDVESIIIAEEWHEAMIKERLNKALDSDVLTFEIWGQVKCSKDIYMDIEDWAFLAY